MSTPTKKDELICQAQLAAALLLQAHARQRLARPCVLKRKGANRSIVPSTGCAGQRLHTSIDRLSSAIDNVVYVEERLPFLRPGTDEAYQELLRVLNFAPGYTINVHVEADISPHALRRKLVAALSEGVPLILDLDPPKFHSGEPFDTSALGPLCSPTHLPYELLCRPRRVFSEDLHTRAKLLGPLVGRARDDAAEHLAALGLCADATEEQIRHAHRKLVRVAHPDRGGDAEAFRRVQAAYEALCGEASAVTGGEHAGAGGLGDELRPAVGFKLLLVSRRLVAPPADVAAWCTAIWTEAAEDTRDAVYRHEILSYDRPSASGGLMSEGEERDLHARFMEGRTHEGDVDEAAARAAELRRRLQLQQRAERRELLRRAAAAMRAQLKQAAAEADETTAPSPSPPKENAPPNGAKLVASLREATRCALHDEERVAREGERRKRATGAERKREEAEIETLRQSVRRRAERLARLKLVCERWRADDAADATAGTDSSDGSGAPSVVCIYNIYRSSFALSARHSLRAADIDEQYSFSHVMMPRIHLSAQRSRHAAEAANETFALVREGPKGVFHDLKPGGTYYVHVAHDATEEAGYDALLARATAAHAEAAALALLDEGERSAALAAVRAEVASLEVDLVRDAAAVEQRGAALRRRQLDEERAERWAAKEAVARRGALLEQTRPIADKDQRARSRDTEAERSGRWAAAAAEVAEAEKRAAQRYDFAALHEASLTLEAGQSDALADAACDGDGDTLRELILQGYDVESKDADGATALSEASCCGHAELVALLLELGADPNTANERGRTPLSRAAFNDHIGIMRVLLEAGAYAEPARWTVHSQAARALLAEYADPAASEARQVARGEALEARLIAMRRGGEGGWGEAATRTAAETRLKRELRRIAAKGNADELRAALEGYVQLELQRRADELGKEAGGVPAPPPAVRAAEVRDEDGHPLLGIAAKAGNAAVAQLLVSEWKRRPAGLAREVWRVEVDARFDGAWRGESGWTAMSLAVSKGHAAVVEVLRAAGANPLVGTSINRSSFAIAANTARQRALGAALPALQETLHEHEVPPGARIAAERPLSLKLAQRDAAQRLLLKQRHDEAASAAAPQTPAAAAAAAAAEKAAEAMAEAKQALGSYRKPSSLSSFYKLKQDGAYGEQALLPKIYAPHSAVATGGGCGPSAGWRRHSLRA